ncbi:uncharacterized protein LOC142219806 [Haematobia irritans]|uniref:uncharacterized protein LOC142219806 n=1 Tax=Haematobia irritans TaxID=7368 RepID=UPI003F505ED1
MESVIRKRILRIFVFYKYAKNNEQIFLNHIWKCGFEIIVILITTSLIKFLKLSENNLVIQSHQSVDIERVRNSNILKRYNIDMERFIFLHGFILFSFATTGLALKCYQCKNIPDARCYSPKKHNEITPTQCPPDTTKCATEITMVSSIEKVVRSCISTQWACKGDCYTCSSDGCNHHNDVQNDNDDTEYSPPLSDYVKGNMLVISAIGLITGLLVIWCSIRLCCNGKDSDDEYEGEDYYEEDDNDDNGDDDDGYNDYDRDDDDDDDYNSIEKEYAEYAKTAEESYEHLKGHTIVHINGKDSDDEYENEDYYEEDDNDDNGDGDDGYNDYDGDDN